MVYKDSTAISMSSTTSDKYNDHNRQDNTQVALGERYSILYTCILLYTKPPNLRCLLSTNTDISFRVNTLRGGSDLKFSSLP